MDIFINQADKIWTTEKGSVHYQIQATGLKISWLEYNHGEWSLKFLTKKILKNLLLRKMIFGQYGRTHLS